ncbi:MAG: hypothetical protein A2745_01750 [Candidatus Harrisonbacteria bacterium RIFCSPHIGHO2_01_FULL_44_13]|uniref:Uncharacterized protein n=1 Tax=Candidatus Harrisonbacteria bacterium RIFCSPLOWO2_01_FULL_44_18 TaxID=1798407 RepID=A0A1G1ZMY3_9BACT|nr:MAG: hypothetical protein A2745_01750 [Candidatus Harrisonbacteria bacterium RIFCSPHIGHO2_01_FULL_44_13]OGY65197.1 MAG: hypothetical protein A3A16_00710 [Candidatus Harrisonbacteria bacterium RIFCSPLOWO2_01_FULL_44_18]
MAKRSGGQRLCLRCGKAKVASCRITRDLCLEIELILRRDPQLPQRVKRSLNEIDKRFYWTLKNGVLYPSEKLAKRGEKPHKLLSGGRASKKRSPKH